MLFSKKAEELMSQIIDLFGLIANTFEGHWKNKQLGF